ncbi:alkaline phosphatase [Luteolibacter sp. GHJ8]|uniref:Alkaline phosphatase n=1 Tax=Luteolibacter rhizosphaerae TaxID=2989719 RepID=A0ABT3FYD0_9BACT|nr:alkaline phosphatase [Luteolibacter rhizosphaerae]MCW1912324.1 alkaline phosphatase [Luteolibacter rhizosphaerae]
MKASSSRRDFLKAASIGSALFGTGSASLLAQETRKSSGNRGLPKKIIFMVSDGMNHGALSLAQHSRSVFEGKTTNWVKMYREMPIVRSLVETFSANSVVTDSAAAASAWGGGKRVNNGAINVDPGNGRPIEAIQSLLKKQSVPLGLVSTATITHATPAGFAANVDSRGDEGAIANQYHERGVEVLLGGGRKFFPDELLKKFSDSGYDLLKDRKELLALKADDKKPVLGLFSSGYVPLTIDRESKKELQETLPTLAEMAELAVKRLDSLAKDRWFLMVEGARIDHCGHANDAAGSIREQLAFDDAIGSMLAYVAAHDDVLLVITTDHGCGGIQLNGVNADPNQGMAPGIYNGTTAAFEKIAGFKRSFEWMGNSGAGLSGPKLGDYIRDRTGIELDKEELKRAQGLKTGELARLFAKRHGIAWTSGNHTGELVEFCAYGPGSHLFPAFMKNEEVRQRLLTALGAA